MHLAAPEATAHVCAPVPFSRGRHRVVEALRAAAGAEAPAAEAAARRRGWREEGLREQVQARAVAVARVQAWVPPRRACDAAAARRTADSGSVGSVGMLLLLLLALHVEEPYAAALKPEGVSR